MRGRAAGALATVVLLAVMAGCDPAGGGLSQDPRSTSDRPAPTDVSEHESGPESPIAYGLQVPRGATQVGPLVRYRSERLIERKARARRRPAQPTPAAAGRTEPRPGHSLPPRHRRPPPSQRRTFNCSEPPKTTPDLSPACRRTPRRPPQHGVQIDTVCPTPASSAVTSAPTATRRTAHHPCLLDAGAGRQRRSSRSSSRSDPGDLKPNAPPPRTKPVME